MSDDNFWLGLWRSVLLAFCLIVATFAGCEVHRQAKVASMVSDGTHPIDARCGLIGSMDSISNPECVIRAQEN